MSRITSPSGNLASGGAGKVEDDFQEFADVVHVSEGADDAGRKAIQKEVQVVLDVGFKFFGLEFHQG